MKYFILLFMLFFSEVLYAQNHKKTLQVEDFAHWKVLENQQISNDGKWVAYELNPQQGDGALVLTDTEGKRTDTLVRGASAAFTPGADVLLHRIKVPFDSIQVAKRKKLKEDQMPLDSVGIFQINTGQITKYPRLVSWQLPEENANWAAILQQPDSVVKTRDELKLQNLILHRLDTGDTLTKRQVTDYRVAKKGNSVIYSTFSGDSTTISRVFVFDTKSGTTHTLFEKNGHIRQVATNEEGNQFAFLFSTDTTQQKTFDLYYAKSTESPQAVVTASTPGIPISWAPSEHRELLFSKNGNRLFLGTAHIPEPEPKDTLAPDEKPVLDIWSWTDAELMPQQLVKLDQEKKRTYLAVYHPAEKKFLQLADPGIPEISLIQDGDGRMALGKDEKLYQKASSWTGRNSADYYVVDTQTGIKRQMVTDKTKAEISPAGKFIIWFDPADSSYYARSTDVYKIQVYALTKNLPVNFYDELDDTPLEVKPYGIAGWSDDDRYVYIYDRYDLWKIDPTGSRVPVNLTSGYGRKNSINLRYVKTDPEGKFIPDGEILVNGFDERNKASGFFTVDTKTVKAPKLHLLEDYRFSEVKKAKEAGRLIWRKESCTLFPDLWTSDATFGHPRKLSDANPQQAGFNWARNQLVSWTSFSGEQLHGILYYPEDFNPNLSYPMIVYFYERSSEELHRHFLPSPSRSIINKTFYASNGYLVFVPDITYQTGYPGQSAFNAVVSGTSFLINQFPFIDKNRIGIQGQSWGGYQTAYLIGQTDMFAAAMAGAPVSNMTSAYGGIRWETGLSRMFQYENTQSRIGGTLWEKPIQYIENSPLFYAPKINTPLLMMHNDQDGAVPWYQGIELFVAMRRLNKPAWLLNYNNEPHNLKKESWENRMDLSRRMKQFFDHYLKGAPMPGWMKYGLPALDKGKELGY
ncbi:S9 family peptidase [Gaoshiqia sediminis]|uniref:Prolyl oligopeptidase family serine peptidase n=1 Tax=Gaoshiqia sediminis TaxID=2986998 RepID=A0AA41YEJ3_9BACT|nr:prolyl oligopeptidase family serine peptidase [Gaoshiqia sediminis]MCW0484392.1 prolyl oligopeptidase family serine peptidase [Gaoshiqia sediminis]